MGMLAAFSVAICAGFGVFRSCTRYRDNMWGAIGVDAIGTAALIVAYHFLGYW